MGLERFAEKEKRIMEILKNIQKLIGRETK